MFRSNARIPDSPSKSSPLQSGIAALGTALGIGVAILFTPTLFSWTKQPLLDHLLATWNEDISVLLIWIFAGVEAFVVYGATKLLFTLASVWSAAALAARRFPH